MREGYVHILDVHGVGVRGPETLSENDITQSEDGTWWIHIRSQKTDTLSSVRLLDMPLQIIEKYRQPKRNSDKMFNLFAPAVFYQADT